MAFVLTPAENEIVMKIFVSTVLGLLIGLERQVHEKPAGLRTLSLVSLGSTLFTIVSLDFFGSGDPSRISAGIVTGIGFLGAGAIFKSENKVMGMTTAAELWIVAAIGLAVGIGMYFMAIVTTIAVLVIIIGGRAFEKKTEKRFEQHRKKYGERAD